MIVDTTRARRLEMVELEWPALRHPSGKLHNFKISASETLREDKLKITQVKTFKELYFYLFILFIYE